MTSSIQTNEDGSISIILDTLGDLGELRYFLQVAVDSNKEKGLLLNSVDINALIEQAHEYINEKVP